MDIIWVGIAGTTATTKARAVDTLMDGQFEVLHTQVEKVRAPATTKPSKWWRVLAIALTMTTFVLGIVWIWTSETNWLWTGVALLIMALVCTVIATPVKTGSGDTKSPN